MRKLKKHLAFALLLTMFGPLALPAQSDSQTLRSPNASLVGIAEFDFGLPMGGRIGYPLSLGGNLIGGYQINRLFTLGIGLGLHGYGPGEMLLLPVFADGRLHFPQKKWTPYIALDMGYAFSLDTLERGGFLLNPSVGGRFPLSDNTALGFGIGLRLQKNQALLDGVFQDYLSNYLSVKVSLVAKLPRLSRKVFKQTMHRMKDKTKREK
ncbi:MAG TPA: hypothetical protein VHS96_11230 [Bacteroidia bacterium]|nr:hypothetical protein [Bacteroidia bacterium]